MKVLVTGGSGYLGSMFSYALMDYGHQPVILDTVEDESTKIVDSKYFYKGDISDKDIIKKIFTEHSDIEIAIHCAELSAVSDSVQNPYEFYKSNVFKSMELFKNLSDIGCNKTIFASSASVYDDVPGYMVTERSPINPRSPFARTKYITELILKDFCAAYNMRCIVLRYFNPIGADPKGRCGVKDKNPQNIIGHLLRILDGEEKTFKIMGNDWDTRDGTCIRDYVHVWDVALANVKAVENFDRAFEKAEPEYYCFLPINIGSGVGVTVQEFIYAFENVTGEKINLSYGQRRPGDIGGSFANIYRAKKTIDWESKMTVEDAILDAINWQEVKKTQ